MWLVVVLLLALAIILAVFTIKIIPQQNVAIIERLGRYHRTLHAGVRIIVPFVDFIRMRHDLRIMQVNVPPQSVITRDNVKVQIDTIIFYQVIDPHMATYEIADYHNGVRHITSATMRQVIGNMELDETLSGREKISDDIRVALDEATGKWGVRVDRVEITDILPPDDIQEAMNSQMKAERERRAIVTAAEAAKRDAILRAEGEQQSQILQAEGEKQARIKQAEGLAQAQILEAEGEAKAIRLVAEAERTRIEQLKQSELDANILTYKSFEALEALANGDSNKVFIPTNAVETLGSIGAMAEMLKPGKKSS